MAVGMAALRAPYACDPEFSRGRLHAEPSSRTRSAFRRDCDRVIHSTAFRRLKHKTQVFIFHEGDHYRTRLTHSLEVAQIARAISRQLGLDEDLTEALALAHDLGHPPFGHAGERALDASLRQWGGFDHNAQALRVVTTLERRYPAFDGLNLTWESLEGIVKHNGPLVDRAGQPLPHYRESGVPLPISRYVREHDLELSSFAGLEAQVAGLSDDIAYDAHDIDDGLRAGLFVIDDLKEVPTIAAIVADIDRAYPGLDEGRRGAELVRELISRLIHDVVGRDLAPPSRGCARCRRRDPRQRAADGGILGADGGDRGDHQGVSLQPHVPPLARDADHGRCRKNRRRPVRPLSRQSGRASARLVAARGRNLTRSPAASAISSPE